MQPSLFTELAIAEQENLTGGSYYYGGYRGEYRNSDYPFYFPKSEWNLSNVYYKGEAVWRISPKYNENYSGGGYSGGGY